MARQSLTDIGVSKIRPRAERYNHPDPALPGHYVRVSPTGTKTYAAIARNPHGIQELITIGDAATLPIEEARKRARVAMQRVKDGLPAFEPPVVSFGAVADDFLIRHAEPNEFRMLLEIRRHLDQNILPAWRDLPVTAIGKTAITELLDKIQDRNGDRQADYCLTIIRMILRWHAARHDGYNPPMFIGMRRQSPKKQRRARTLSDHEICAVWNAADGLGVYGILVKFLLLTGQRLDKVRTMMWSDLLDDRKVWKIRTESVREKSHGGTLRLPPLVRAVLAPLQPIAGNPYVFDGRKGCFNGLSKAKARLDRASGITGWTPHDLRRTARTLMPRAGVPADDAERLLGHVPPGIRGNYDWHSYTVEKANALQKLAVLIHDIVQSGSEPVVRRA
jgi:integrase